MVATAAGVDGRAAWGGGWRWCGEDEGESSEASTYTSSLTASHLRPPNPEHTTHGSASIYHPFCGAEALIPGDRRSVYNIGTRTQSREQERTSHTGDILVGRPVWGGWRRRSSREGPIEETGYGIRRAEEEEHLLTDTTGKTAPRLVEDLLDYDPRLENDLGRNILTSLPSTSDLYSNITSIIPSDNCHHNFVGKQSQGSRVPAQDTRPEYGSVYVVAAICQHCRQHLDLTISWTDFHATRTQGFASCPTQPCPLHHFQYIKEATHARRHGIGAAATGVDRSFLFRCSSESCQASLEVSLREPVFTDASIDLLVSAQRLQERYETAKRRDPTRNDFQIARPAAALDALATYLKDGMNTDNTRRQIPLLNKRFMVTFGDDCQDLLRSLGFTINDTSEDGFCHLPQPNDHSDPAAFIEYLQDVREELIILLHQMPTSETQGARSILASPRSVLADIRRCLSFQGYATNSRTRTRTVDLTSPDNAFAGLGALPDFSDSLVIFAFERQRDCNPDDSAYYIDCLGAVLEQRPQSEMLGTELAILKSAGQHGSKDIEAAFAYFNLSRQQSHVYDEDHIIGLFNSRISDSGPSTHAEAREALRMIGESLNSQKIRDVASTVLETYEHALQYLELDMTSQEDAVQAMFGVKVAENQELAEKALQIVADHRDSTYLKELLHQSQAGAPAMDLAEAFRILGVEDRSTFDSSMLDILLATRIEEAPSREKDFARAAEVIRTSGDSSIVNNASSRMNIPPRPLAEWPVGLQNLGNTCYLNSLLQYYFTIKPFRDLLLNLKEHKQDAQTLASAKKKVGGMQITKEQLERCQELAEQLGDLFKDMITSPTNSVRPTLKLASDALNKVDKQMEATLRRRSTIGGNRPFTLGQIDGAPVQGPSLPPGSLDDETLRKLEDEGQGAEKAAVDNDSASDITLVGGDPTPQSSDGDAMADGEWEQVEDIAKPGSTDVPMSGAAVSDEPGVAHTGSRKKAKTAGDIYDIPSDDDLAPPDRPPPVPPRNKSVGIQLSQVEEAAKQQDVNEVIGNVLFQSEVAIRPDGVFEDTGEQDDLIKRIFFGKIKFNYATVDKQPKTDDSTEVRPEWPINLARKPADLMEALDNIFDLEHVDLGGRRVPRYVTIETLPPILQIFIPRIGWDDEKKTTFKLETPLLLQERIFMDQFMDGQPGLIEKRRKRWKWKKELRVLEARRAQLGQTSIPDTNMAEALEGAGELLEKMANDKTFHGELMDEDLDTDSSLAEDMRKRAAEIKDDIRALDQRIWGLKESLKDEFDDPSYQQLAYRLHAIFIHRGSAGFGHYWVYIHDFQRNKWLKYNDEYVTEEEDFDVAKICAAEGKPAATPYFCVYVKEGMEGELVESLHRFPVEDVEMGGATLVIEGIEV